MKYLIYISTAIKLMTDEQLVEILNTARKNNIERNVTGILLYSEGTFIQVLEGGEENVDYIFTLIKKDTRHKNVIKLIEDPLDERNFPDWAMGFSTVDATKTKDLIGYLKSTDELLESNINHTGINVLKTFITTNNLLINN